MLHVQCPGCLTSAYIECNCPPGVSAGDGHLYGCRMADLDAEVTCPEDSSCCQEDHHHGEAANVAGEACRPLTITVLPGSVQMQHVPLGGV
jgi:hypothetical protein